MCISIHTDFHSASQPHRFSFFLSRFDTAQLCRKMQINKCRICWDGEAFVGFVISLALSMHESFFHRHCITLYVISKKVSAGSPGGMKKILDYFNEAIVLGVLFSVCQKKIRVIVSAKKLSFKIIKFFGDHRHFLNITPIPPNNILKT